MVGAPSGPQGLFEVGHSAWQGDPFPLREVENLEGVAQSDLQVLLTYLEKFNLRPSPAGFKWVWENWHNPQS